MPRRAKLQDDMVAESDAMRAVAEATCALADSDAPVLIRGELGAGRAFVAAALHRAGPRGGAELATVHAESPAAVTAIHGALAREQTGTLLIRELGQAGKSAQKELHALLAAGDFGRTRGPRLVATCEPELDVAARSGWFHEELVAGLGSHVIDVPPLRERAEDIVPLFAAQVRRHAADIGRGRMSVSSRAHERLVAYPWPGNVLELERVARRVVIGARTSRIHPGDIDAILPVVAERVPLEEISLEDMVRGKLVEFLRTVDGYPLSGLYEHVLARVERPLLGLIMEHTGGNQVRAAEILGLNRNTLRRKLSERNLLDRGKAVLRTKSKSNAGRRAKGRSSSRSTSRLKKPNG